MVGHAPAACRRRHATGVHAPAGRNRTAVTSALALAGALLLWDCAATGGAWTLLAAAGGSAMVLPLSRRGSGSPPPGRADAEQFRLLVQQVREYAIFLLDPEGRVASWNEGAERIKGYAAEEIVGAHFSRFYPEEDIASGRPERALAAARDDGQLEDEGWRVRRDGSRFWASVVITAIHDDTGALAGFAKVTRDLTERRETEAARERVLAETDKRLRELRCLHRVADEIRREPPMQELLERVGRALPEAMREPGQVHVAIHLDEYAWESATAPRSGPRIAEPIRVDGTDRGELAVVYERPPADGDASGFSDEERETVRAVATTLAESAERQRKAHELERYAQELESFSYSVSHDLRAPLRALDGFSQALAQKYPDALDERGRDYLQRIRKASQRMSHLIDALLRLSRISRQRMQWQPLDLSALADEVVEDLRDADPGLEVEVRCQPRLRVWGDAALLRVVLQNLLGNAWKFSRDAEHPVIELGRDPDHRNRFYVRDNGVGFDARYVDRLFGAFQRLHSEAEFEGTGIGLVTVRRVVLRHGGEVWAESAPGEGATFWFELRPAAAARLYDDGGPQDDTAGRG